MIAAAKVGGGAVVEDSECMRTLQYQVHQIAGPNESRAVGVLNSPLLHQLRQYNQSLLSLCYVKSLIHPDLPKSVLL